MQRSSDLPRTSNNQIRFGTVSDVDLDRGLCRIATGDIHSDFVPWLVPRAGETIEWSSPSVGEQVVLLSPGGDVTGAVALRGLYSTQFAPPGNSATLHRVKYADGAVIQYDHGNHELVATLPGGGKATLTADGGVTVNGPFTVNGDTTLNGHTQVNGDADVSQTLTAQTDVVGGGKSLKTHPHTNVQPGSGVSGPPQ
ncbi:phage baseplate assembly protein V [Pseudoxanthomonas wuyuanensis]|nr:phage baseplate assembly protein V [Pseudoxanthomonas wuyuanensis]KAF1719802.1 phage baseplate assembly protein V [Pseudoxanthomonas wuyuanensis]